jgi:hypothetical protein
MFAAVVRDRGVQSEAALEQLVLECDADALWAELGSMIDRFAAGGFTPWKAVMVYEVCGAGFDASTDETDHRVVWVLAPSEAAVIEAIKGTGATFHGEVLDASIQDADYMLPGHAERLAGALLQMASEDRNKHRKV